MIRGPTPVLVCMTWLLMATLQIALSCGNVKDHEILRLVATASMAPASMKPRFRDETMVLAVL
jgi:hypothetical protein